MRMSLLPRLVLGLIFVLLVVNGLALYYHLYFYLWWLDIPMHLLGGAWVALMTLFLYERSTFFQEGRHNPFFLAILVVASTLSIGLGWELFELSAQTWIERATHADLADTLADLVNDLVGALVAVWFFIRFHPRLRS
jgi:uncharacterized membrane protein YjdF